MNKKQQTRKAAPAITRITAAPEARGLKTRQKLIDAAHALIWANSYAHVSVDDICRKAGVLKGSFYHFFPTKIDLAAAALEDHWTTVKPKLDAIFSDHKTPQAQLKALCKEIFLKQQTALESTGTVCGCPYATVGAEISNNNETLRELSVKMSERFCGYFEQLLKNAASAGLIPASGIKQRAQEMHVYVIGAMLHARITNQLDCVKKPLEIALFRMSGMDSALPLKDSKSVASRKPMRRAS